MRKEIVCINCPMGCRLDVELDGGKVTDVAGATCKKGVAYAEVECTNPTRIVTSTVRLAGCATLPVKTERPVPKGKIMDCVRSLKDIELTAPVAIGDVVVENVCGTGINIVATRNAS